MRGALLVLAALLVAGCAPDATPEDRIAALVDEAARAFEEGDTGPIRARRRRTSRTIGGGTAARSRARSGSTSGNPERGTC